MGKKINENKQKGKPKREKRRNIKQIPREHWKFKNGSINKKVL